MVLRRRFSVVTPLYHYHLLGLLLVLHYFYLNDDACGTATLSATQRPRIAASRFSCYGGVEVMMVMRCWNGGVAVGMHWCVVVMEWYGGGDASEGAAGGYFILDASGTPSATATPASTASPASSTGHCIHMCWGDTLVRMDLSCKNLVGLKRWLLVCWWYTLA